jgi:DNA-binding NtrC family response regulator
MEENVQWLKSPVTERAKRLHPMRDLLLSPYYGRRRKVRLIRSEIVIGNSPSCDLVLQDPFVSARHAQFCLEPGGFGYSVKDLSSQNGVFLNGVRVTSAPLPSSGTLRIGRSSLSWSEEAETEVSSAHGWIVADPRMLSVIDSLKQAAACRVPVLLLGETGTGKDVLARILHQLGPGGSAPYVPVNCALAGGPLAESELFGHCKGAFTGAEKPRLGALRSAHGGTLFLDEIADMPAAAQVKLLRAIEIGEVKALGSDQAERSEFRLVSATSRELDACVANGSFRADLYFRIAGFVIRVPPLRERPRDILAIARKLSTDRGLDLDQEAEERLIAYRWPGNVRELRACMERALAFAKAAGIPRILPEHILGLNGGISGPTQEQATGPRTLFQVERDCLEASLERNGWSRTITAKELGISRSCLWEKLKRHKLSMSPESRE